MMKVKESSSSSTEVNAPTFNPRGKSMGDPMTTIRKTPGAPASVRTKRIRSCVKSALIRAGFDDRKCPVPLSTTDIAKAAKQAKAGVIMALYHFEKANLVKRLPYRAEPVGRGQPPAMWLVNPEVIRDDGAA